MKRLRTILQSKKVLCIILLLIGIITIIRINIPYQSKYHEDTTNVIGILISIQVEENKVTLIVKGKEKIQGTYYFNTEKERKKIQENLNLGDTIKIIGTLSLPREPTTENLFNYKKYLNKQKIYYLIEIDKIIKEKENTSLYYKIKNKLEKKITNPYIKAFLIGNQDTVSKEAKTSYQENGISHLFAISGMQFYLLANFLLRLLKRINIKEKTGYKIVFLILFCYLVLIEKTASIIRSILFFFIFSINKVWNLSLNKKTLIILSLSITLLINPFYITEVAFWYSYVISIGLLLFTKEDQSYLKTVLKTSSLAFFLSIPISLYYFYEINILSIIYILFYIPFVNMI